MPPVAGGQRRVLSYSRIYGYRLCEADIMRQMARRFKALSEEPRLDILSLLFRYGELCGCEVERFLEMSQSKASRHLRYLRNEGLVEDRREGLWI